MMHISEKVTNGVTPTNNPYFFSPKTVPKAHGKKIFTYLAKKLSISSRPSPKSVKDIQGKRKKGNSLLKKTLIAQAKRTAALTLSLSASFAFSDKDETTPKSFLEGPDNVKYSAYALDIYSYLKDLEDRYSLPADFLRGKSTDVVNMRNVVADWLIRVHSFCHLHLETYYLAMGIVDRYIRVEDLTITEFKTLGVTALYIATKYEEKYNPKLRAFGVETSHFNQVDINELEAKILLALDFRISFPLPVPFYRLLSKLASVTSTERDVGRYVMELSACNHRLATCPPSLYAAAALYLTLRLCRNCFEWNDDLKEVSDYHVEDMMPIVQEMSDYLLKSQSRKFQYTAAKDKYAQDMFHRVSTLPHFQSALIHSFAKSS